LEARSQDTGLAVLVVIERVAQGILPVVFAGWKPAPRSSVNFSVKEKDEASLPNRIRGEFVECLHSPFLAGSEGFLFGPLNR